MSKYGRNEPCYCGSKKKFKRCHGANSGDPSKNAAPPLVYRYLKRKYVNSFRDEGTLQISPLHAYQTIGDNRQDGCEGKKVTNIRGPGGLTESEAYSLFGVRNSIEFGDGGTLSHRINLPNGYLVSASTRLCPEIMKRFGCDAYFTITDIEKFKAALGRALSQHMTVGRSFASEVLYSRASDANTPMEIAKLGPSFAHAQVEDYFRKDADPYEVESEYRFVFLVDCQKPIEPLLITLTPDEIRSCCKFEDEVPQAGGHSS